MWLLLPAARLAVAAVPLMLGLTHPQLKAQSAGSPALTEDWEKAAGGKLAFEVASIRPNTSDRDPTVNFVLGPGDAYASNGGLFSTSNLSLLTYIRFAYKLTDSQTMMLQSQAPKWIATARFDIEAKSDNHAPSKNQMRLMMQSLLAERFKLAVHTETRQLPVLALVLARPGKIGPRLRPHPSDGPPCSATIMSQSLPEPMPARPPTVSGGFPTICGDVMSTGVASSPSHIRLGARNVPIALLAGRLNGMLMGNLDRPVLDRTGLIGTFDFVLEWGGEPPPGSNLPPDASTVTLLEALTDQLGLKLISAKGPVDVLVIDHVEQPSEN